MAARGRYSSGKVTTWSRWASGWTRVPERKAADDGCEEWTRWPEGSRRQ
jgi:hypothetical protein